MGLQYSILEQKKEFDSQHIGEPLYNMLDYTFAIPENYSYTIFEVSADYIARPDLISYDAYGDASFADIICKLNGISNPFELNTGMKLIIPTIDSLTDFILTPSVKDRDENWGPRNNQSTAKAKNSKRQANEAITGDSRFKIDKANGVIIY